MQRWDPVGKAFLVFLITLILLLFFHFIVVRVEISYAKKGGGARFALNFSACYGLFSYKLKLPDLKEKTGLNRPVGKIKMLAEQKKLVNYFFRFLLKARLRRLTWHTRIGTGEPVETGLLAGTVWGLKGAILSVLYHIIPSAAVRSDVDVQPSFDKACFNTDFYCALDISLRYFLVFLFKYSRFKY